MNHYDILVIGGGPGGMGAALRAAELGRKTALVERAELGGVCLNWGCIPTKALLKSAQALNYCRNAANYGIEVAGEVEPDMAKIVARSRTVAENMNKGVMMLFKKHGIEIIHGFGKLTSAKTVDVCLLYTSPSPRD